MKCIFIYNPVGGKGKVAAKLSYIIKELKEKYDEVDVYATKCAGDMTQMAKEAAQTYDVIVFAGGDGSFNEVVQGVADLEHIPQLGYIPTGTTNDIAHTLKIPANIKKALKVIKHGKCEKVDCMKVNDRYAMYVVAAGAFTSATYMAPQKQKNKLGWLAYGIEGLKNNLKLQVFDVICKKKNESYCTDCVLITFINSRYVGGFKMNRQASIKDGKIEGIVVHQKKKPNFFKRIRALLTIARLFLFGYNTNAKHLSKFEGSSFDIEVGEDVTWNIDGEKGGTGNVHIEVVPRKIPIIVSEKYQ
ncbi:MAG: YegS/Rv2252/BmrU family lipid kinase [Clostridia bacterium]|nr:YegS/Rv2252/BmrU family lipid kinase [Clostridia bacterium]